jgi:hypothetical protein
MTVWGLRHCGHCLAVRKICHPEGYNMPSCKKQVMLTEQAGFEKIVDIKVRKARSCEDPGAKIRFKILKVKS